MIRGWGATHLLREVPHAVCVRVCAPFETRKHRMMERLGSDDDAQIAGEIRTNDEAHSAIMRRHFDLQWTDPEHYARRSRARRAAETREAQVSVTSESGKVILSGAGSTDEMLAFVEVAAAVPGVRDVAYRTNPGEELRPRFH